MNEARELLREFAVSRTTPAQLELSTLLKSTAGGVSGTTLAERCEADRSTVYRRLERLNEIGFVDSESRGGFQLTRAGCRAVEAYEKHAAALEDKSLAYLTRSADRIPVLDRLHGSPAYATTLAEEASLPSRTTLHRVLTECDNRGWTIRTDERQHVLTPAGERCLKHIQRLLAELQGALTAAPAINMMAYWADPPLDALREGTCIVEQEDDPHAVLNAAIEAAGLRENRLQRLRTVVPIFDPVIYERFGEHIDTETQLDVLLDVATFRQLTSPSRLHHLAGMLLAPSVEVRVYPDPLYTGLGIYNDEAVMIGGSTRRQVDAAVVGTTEPLRRWATRTFDDLWADAETPSGRLSTWLKQSRIAALR